MSAPILTVAIATTAARVGRIDPTALPSLPGLCYRVFVQGEVALPQPARPDLTYSPAPGIGAAMNRNAALQAVTTPLLLFADDDLTFRAAGLAALISRFNAQPQADFLCARLSDETGRPRKRYGRDGQPVRWWNCARVGTPELALRPDRFRARGIGFDPGFGAGVADHLGDEYIFLCDALAAGLQGRHVDVTLAAHPAESSGTRADAASMPIRRRVLIRALGPWKSRPARLAFALRHWRRFDSLRAFWRFL